ncbi:MAG: response regulator transcription factor [Bacteroidota bacterium]|nr:response regulator transcription factor [Bacteroidota bacterium]
MPLTLKQKPDIILVDDQQLFRQGLKAIINYEDIGCVIGEAKDGEEFLALLTTLKPDIVLMDIDMPQMNGFEATKKSLEILPKLKIIAFSFFSEEEYSREMMEIGAKGFLLKSNGIKELKHAIKMVMNGESYFVSESRKIFNNDFEKTDPAKAPEKEVNKTRAKGKMQFFPWGVNRKSAFMFDS